MSNVKEKAVDLFNQGYSCSESIVRAAYEANIIDRSTDIELITKMATPFSGGMSSGCLCGAVAGAQMVLGLIHGRVSLDSSPAEAKAIAKKFIDTFKEQRKATCCKALTAKYDFHSPERRQHCVGIVQEVAEILEEMTNLH
jgi:C_GCAxxG_C_C family probable redox protein